MNCEDNMLIDPTIFESLEALDSYLKSVRTRREQRREARLRIEHLSAAIALVREEMDAAQQDHDTDIATELEGVLAEFERRLILAFALTPHTVVQSVPALSVEPMLAVSPIIAYDKACAETPDVPIPSTEVDTVEEGEAAYDLPAAPIVVPTEVSKEQEEAWFGEIVALSTQWVELDKEGLHPKDRFLNRPACFRMRSLTCTLARIQVQAEETSVGPQIERAATELRNRMELARVYAGDSWEALPFDESAWIDTADRLSADAWEELSGLYTVLAEAQEAFDWYGYHCEELGQAAPHGLVNAIGAAQQMLFRALEEYGGSDRLQGDLFGGLREAANHVGFLSSLHVDTPWEELERLAQTLPTMFARAKRDAEGAREKREKDARKAEALQPMLKWQDESNMHELSEAAVTAKRAKLLPLLDACIEANIPPTNVQVRSVLLNAAPVLLKDLSHYAKFLDAVLAERKRKGMDLVPNLDAEVIEDEADLHDDLVTQSTAYLRLLVENQKVLILGGSARPQVAQKLKELLGCADVEWADSKKGDRMNKFKAMISRADLIVVVKNFASHEMTEKGRDWAKEYGKLFVLLPGGYGANQIINQMYLQLVPTDAKKKVAVIKPKTGMSLVSDLTLA